MSRETWNIIKQSKQFYVKTYRKVGSALFISVSVNLFLAVVVYYLYFNQPDHAFYATSGITAPVLLTAMDSPNYTSTPLLGADPIDEDENKAIPQ